MFQHKFWLIRKYSNGAKLMPHLDHMETHVISAILNIAQQVQSTVLNPPFFVQGGGTMAPSNS